MEEISEEAVLLAINTREELFDSLDEMLNSDNYQRVLMSLEEGKSQSEIADELGIGNATVSRAISQLQEYDLVLESENGYKKFLSALNHPIIQYYYKTERMSDE